MKGLSCEICGSEEFVNEYITDGLYICNVCNKIIGYYCRGCNRFYKINRLGLHGDVYECKNCGKIQWGYTEYNRKQ